jgi:serine/threonine-protein kinase
MGSVYLARTSGPGGFERYVVLKMLDAIRDEDALAMFLDEARIIGRMHHQHIAPAFELGQEDGHYFLIMEYVHGQTAMTVWARAIELGMTLPLSFTLTVISAAASALHYAHNVKARDGRPLEIVHRDVSLSNVMIGYDGAIKLIDFGIAKASQRVAVTQSGMVKGKVSYMAPELLAGKPIDRRADIFALGVVMYELATMMRPFRSATDRETVERIKIGQFVPPSQLVKDLPLELEDIILRAMHKDVAKRYQDAEEMRRELAAYANWNRMALGDRAITTLMDVLFEEREDPWWSSPADAVPEPREEPNTAPVTAPVLIYDDGASVSVKPPQRYPRGTSQRMETSTDFDEATVPVDDRDPADDARTQPFGTSAR